MIVHFADRKREAKYQQSSICQAMKNVTFFLYNTLSIDHVNASNKCFSKVDFGLEGKNKGKSS